MRVSYDVRLTAQAVRESAEDAGEAWAVALCDTIISAYWGRWKIGAATVARLVALAEELEIA